MTVSTIRTRVERCSGIYVGTYRADYRIVSRLPVFVGWIGGDGTGRYWAGWLHVHGIAVGTFGRCAYIASERRLKS